jgi:hypothetical protein
VELRKIVGSLLDGGGSPPSFSNLYDEVADGADSISSDLSWSLKARDGEIVSFPDSTDNPFFYPGLYTKGESSPTKNCILDLRATTTAWVLGLDPPEVNLSTSVTDFTVHIGWGSGGGFNGVRIPIKSISFTSKNGQKPDFQISLGSITFVGPVLKFIDQLQEEIQKLGGTKTGWRIAYENGGVVVDAPPLMLPNIQLGAFSVENLGIYSGLLVPFFGGGGITARFSLAKPDSRARLSCGIYLGQLYALIELDTDYVRRFELCIEFGAGKSLSYGPVRGDVGVVGGVNYQSIFRESFSSPGMPPTKQSEVALEAFVRAFGTFSAWNLISLFMELYVGLKTSSGSQVAGTARFSISARIAFVSYSYSASHQETLAKGSGGTQISSNFVAANSYVASHQQTLAKGSGGTQIRSNVVAATEAKLPGGRSTIYTDVPFVTEQELLELVAAYGE